MPAGHPADLCQTTGRHRHQTERDRPETPDRGGQRTGHRQEEPQADAGRQRLAETVDGRHRDRDRRTLHHPHPGRGGECPGPRVRIPRHEARGGEIHRPNDPQRRDDGGCQRHGRCCGDGLSDAAQTRCGGLLFDRQGRGYHDAGRDLHRPDAAGPCGGSHGNQDERPRQRFHA